MPPIEIAAPELTTESTVHERVDMVMSLLGDDDDGLEPVATTESAPEIPAGQDEPADTDLPAGDAEPGEETTEDADEGEVEPAEAPAIELPNSIPAELKTALAALDPESQRKFAQWQTERDRGVSTKLQESAERLRLAEQNAGQVQPERQKLAQQLDLATNLLRNFDPVITKCAAMTPQDWNTLANEDAAGYVQLKAEYESRQANLNAALQARQQLDQQTRNDAVQREYAQLVAAIPEMADPAKRKAFAAEMNRHGETYGFKPEEIASIVDHRMVKVMADAMKWREQETKRTSAAGKLARPVPTVVRPGKGSAETAGASRSASLKRAAASGSASELADAIAAAW